MIVPADVALRVHGTAEVGDVDLLDGIGATAATPSATSTETGTACSCSTPTSAPGRCGSSAPYDEAGMPLPTFATSSDERVIAGVCAGIAQTLAVDATLVRLVFALLALAGGAGIVLYLALWA